MANTLAFQGVECGALVQGMNMFRFEFKLEITDCTIHYNLFTGFNLKAPFLLIVCSERSFLKSCFKSLLNFEIPQRF